MSTGGWIATAAGPLLVLAGLREVFHSLLHPSGVGGFTPQLFRAVWRLAHRRHGPSIGVAGPLALVLTIATWTTLLIVGFALVYWPHLPERFHVAPGISRAEQGGLLDALYVSAVALSTLGFGDVVAEAAPLRLALALEALIGFALLTASISWVLSIYPALMRRRALAGRLSALIRTGGAGARLAPGDPPVAQALVLHEVADQLGTVRVDLIQFPASYFFHRPDPSLSLPAVLPALRSAIRDGDLPEDVAGAAARVGDAVQALERTLAEGPFGLQGEDVVAAYAADHRAPGPPARPAAPRDASG